MLGRLLQRFQQGIERILGEHVYFIDDVHFITATRRAILRVFNNLTHIINAGIRSGIHLNQINKAAFRNFLTRRALATRLGADTGFAIQTFGQNTGDCCFSYSACTGKQISMMQAIVIKSIDQRLQDMLLSHHFAKKPGPPFAGQYLVTHGNGPLESRNCITALYTKTRLRHGNQDG